MHAKPRFEDRTPHWARSLPAPGTNCGLSDRAPQWYVDTFHNLLKPENDPSPGKTRSTGRFIVPLFYCAWVLLPEGGLLLSPLIRNLKNFPYGSYCPRGGLGPHPGVLVLGPKFIWPSAAPIGGRGVSAGGGADRGTTVGSWLIVDVRPRSGKATRLITDPGGPRFGFRGEKIFFF